MNQTHTFGTHIISREEETGFIVLKQRGGLTGDEARVVMAHIEKWLKPAEPLLMLSDSSEATAMSPEARAVFGEIGQTKRSSFVAIYGSSFQMRVVSNLLLTAMRMLGQNTVGRFEKDEATARAWLTEQKAKAA